MAYVVARPKGRFEVRESLHTANGPRARSLVGFDVLTDEVVAAAAGRATRPFDAEAVIASGRRAGAPVVTAEAAGAAGGVRGSAKRFVEASRRMALSTQRAPSSRVTDPGEALIGLLGFVEAVRRSQPARPFEPLAFPVMARLVRQRHVPAGTG
ncbi:MAG TPA: hypothetical protein VGH60_08330 [Solirubrobacteraceae bacterium]|jgi:hypothetical protein